MSAISGNADLPLNENMYLYTVPDGKCATVTVALLNRDAVTSREVSILIVRYPHTMADFIEYYALVPPRGVLERTGLVMTAGEVLFVTTHNGVEVSGRFHGFEEEA